MTKELLKQSIEKIDEYNKQQKFQATWESLSAYEIPKWFTDAKIGVFYHWGVYTVPHFGNEWYPRSMYQQGGESFEYHRKNFGEHKDFGYKDFIPMFTAEKFDPAEWIELAKSLNARYIIPVAEHHDGFQMYESAISDFNAYKMGPKRDIMKELEKEATNSGIKFGVSSHRAEHYWFMDEALNFDSGISNPEYGDLYWPTIKVEDLNKDVETTTLYLEDWLVRSCELVDLLKPRIVYFDTWAEIPIFKPYMCKFLAYYYNKSIEFYGDHGVMTYKQDAVPYRVAVRDMENGQFATMQPDYWQTCSSTYTNGWAYTPDNSYKKPLEIVRVLIDAISKNGCLLLNVGPHTDGSIIEKDKEFFKRIGSWVEVNSEAIFESKPWKIFGEGPNNTTGGSYTESLELNYTREDMRFTTNKSNIYVHVMNPQSCSKLEVKSMGIYNCELTEHACITSVEALDPRVSVTGWTRLETYLEVEVECEGDWPIVLKVTVE